MGLVTMFTVPEAKRMSVKPDASTTHKVRHPNA
jgi:hypothetical protein